MSSLPMAGASYLSWLARSSSVILPTSSSALRLASFLSIQYSLSPYQTFKYAICINVDIWLMHNNYYIENLFYAPPTNYIALPYPTI